jgi:hypothetical protein
MVFWPERKSSYENFRIDGRSTVLLLLMVKKHVFKNGWFWCANQPKTNHWYKASDRSKAEQPGIPDSTDNQLKDGSIMHVLNIEVNDKELQVAIKGDAKEEYPAIKSDGYFTRSKNQL